MDAEVQKKISLEDTKIDESSLGEHEEALREHEVAPQMQVSDPLQTLEALLNGDYRILQTLGRGAQGHVFLAENVNTGQKVAIKQLLIHSVKDWKLYDLFHREAETLKRIDVLGVAKLHETREILTGDSPMALIIQDYIEGDSMQTFIAKGHRFRIDQIGEILLQLTDILEKLHHSQPPVIHRDLKPSNILLQYDENSSTPKVYIIDFGAVANPQVKGGGSTVVGTYGYMAPEQLMGHAEPKSDIYSLAIIAVYLMSGVAPENLEIKDFHVLIDAHLEHLPYEITAFLRSMLAPKCEDRIGEYAVIRRFFVALRDQKFQAIPQVSGNISAKRDKKYSLENVKSYHQEGNIEIWQALSDKTPRKFPREIRSYLTRNKRRVHSNIDWEYYKSYKGYNPYSPAWLIFICLVISCIGLTLSFGEVRVFGNFITVVGIIAIIPSIIFKRIEYENDLLEDVRNIIKNGRKSMATVVRIEYHVVSTNQSNLADHYDERATWILTYSFNPPDDSSPDPIVHRWATHASLGNLKEGDLIPILYQIRHHCLTKQESVVSMPFPVANCDMWKVIENGSCHANRT